MNIPIPAESPDPNIDEPTLPPSEPQPIPEQEPPENQPPAVEEPPTIPPPVIVWCQGQAEVLPGTGQPVGKGANYKTNWNYLQNQQAITHLQVRAQFLYSQV
jgi:hypothetical protein